MSIVDYSIVIPVYYNEGTLFSTAQRIHTQVFQKFPEKIGEILFVDDGSMDFSYNELIQIKKQFNNIRVIKLSRNFGQVNAIWCGLKNVSGPAIVISADGQDPVNIIVDMLTQHFYNKIEVVVAVRESRDESKWRKFSSRIVYKGIQALGNKEMPAGGFDFFLLGNTSRIALLKHWQPNTFLQVRVLDLGFSRVFIPYHREERKAGVSRWTLSKKITYMIDGVLGHSYLPIRMMSLLGFVFAGISFVLGIVFLVSYFFNENIIRGFTPIVLLILLLGGIQMIMIGVLGEYLWRVLVQVRNDEPYLIENNDEKCI
jgi:dolichol-phosphate mannosyltransferase